MTKNHIRTRPSVALVLSFVLLFSQVWTVYAQDQPTLIINLSRDFGYSSGTGKIQGTFSMRASGPDDLVRVVFYIDGVMVGEDNEKPFSYQFHTGQYSLGIHTLNATGYTQDGGQLQSNTYRREFVSSDEGMQAAGRIAIPILGVTFLIMLLGFVVPTLIGRGKNRSLAPGTPRNYGLLGGTICPKCGRPFPLSLFGSNLVVGRLERCPHCGKWSLVHRSSLDALRAAEAAELETAQQADPTTGISAEEKLRKELEDSRFHDI